MVSTLPILIGREPELTVIKNSLESGKKNNGSVIFISGPAGIGKTALADISSKFAVDQGYLVMRGKCLIESLTPYMPIREALRYGNLDNLLSESLPPKLIASYLVLSNGLMGAKSERQTTNLDPEIFSSMLTAVSDFVKDSMNQFSDANGSLTQQESLNRMGYGKYTILIEKGDHASIASIIEGNANESLINDIREKLFEIETKFSTVFISWNGDMDEMKEPGKILGELLGSEKYEGIDWAKDDPKSKRSQLFENVVLGIARASKRQPVLLILDDLHWADQSTLSMLQYISRNSRNLRVVMIGTYRPEDIIKKWDGTQHQLSEIIQAMRRDELCKEVHLEPLNESDTSLLIKSVLIKMEGLENFAKLVHKETEGNPLYAKEILSLLKSEGAIEFRNGLWKTSIDLDKIHIPSKVQDIITRRVARLEKNERELLDAASVVGEIFSSDVLKRITGIAKIDILKMLNEIEKTHKLIAVHENNYRFSHVKIREIIYESVLPELRKEYNLLTADAMIEIFKDTNIDAQADIAFHYYCARSEKCISYCIDVAKKAKSRFENDEALQNYAHALEIIHDQDKYKNERALILEDMGDIYKIIGSYDKAIACYRKVNDVSPEDTELCGRMWRKISSISQKKGDYESTLKQAAIGKKIVGDKSLEYWKLVSHEVYAHMWMGNYDKSTALAKEAIKNFEKFSGTEQDKLDIYTSLGTSSWYRGQYSDALTLYNKSLELAEGLGDLQRIAASYNNIGNVHYKQGDLIKALEYYSKCMKIHEKVGDQQGVAIAFLNIGNILLEQNELPNAYAFSEKSLRIHEKIGDPHGIAMAYCNLGDVNNEKGDFESAEMFYQKSIKISNEIGVKDSFLGSLLGLAEISLATGRIDDALKYSIESEYISGESKLVSFHARSERILGRIYWAKKDELKSQDHFSAALNDCAALNSKTENAKTLVDYGSMLLEKDDTLNGMQNIENARLIFSGCGMALWEKKCSDILNKKK